MVVLLEHWYPVAPVLTMFLILLIAALMSTLAFATDLRANLVARDEDAWLGWVSTLGAVISSPTLL